MTSRRCTVLEQGAREQLMMNGYEVRILPTGQNKRQSPAHLVAGRLLGETRCIRIQKISHRSATIETVEDCCMRDIARYRSEMVRHPMDSTILYEIRLYSLPHRYHCFTILPDRIREIPNIMGKIPDRVSTGEAS